jgi:hypothetical protein
MLVPMLRMAEAEVHSRLPFLVHYPRSVLAITLLVLAGRIPAASESSSARADALSYEVSVSPGEYPSVMGNFHARTAIKFVEEVSQS